MSDNSSNNATSGVPARASLPILPGATLGVLGGGQLGRMFVHAAQALGYDTAVLDPDPAGPACRASQYYIEGAYDDPDCLRELADRCAAVTTEFENVPAVALAALAGRCTVSPPPRAVAAAQDRVQEKAHFQACGVPCAPYAVIETLDDAAIAAAGPTAAPDHPNQASAPPGSSKPQALERAGALLLPGILKTSRMGYDGKGQARVANTPELLAAWEHMGRAPCVLEQLLPLALECSVIVARGANGDCVHLPVQRNLHRDGILAVTEVFEGNVPLALSHQALEAAKSIASSLQYVGVLCVEFFVLQDGSLVVNEMAPRPHNSGHYSLDACDVSQFELQVRTLAGLPLTQPRLHSPAVMLNLLGDLWFAQKSDVQATPDWAGVLALPGVHLHLYGKALAHHGRKMGHLTITAASIDAARDIARQAAKVLGLPDF